MPLFLTIGIEDTEHEIKNWLWHKFSPSSPEVWINGANLPCSCRFDFSIMPSQEPLQEPLQEPTNESRRADLLEKVEQRIKAGENVRDACALAGVLRSQFYKWRARRDQNPAHGLRDRSHRAKAYPRNISPRERDRILELAVEFPKEGCDRLKTRLQSEGISRSSTAIQNVLRQEVLESQYLRQLRQEAQLRTFFLGSRRQLQKLSPRRSRSKRAQNYKKMRASQQPGQAVLQGFYEVRAPTYLGGLYLHFIFDVATEWVWFDLMLGLRGAGVPHPDDPIDLLKNGALAAFARKDVRIRAIITKDCPPFVERKRPLSSLLGASQSKRRSIYSEFVAAQGIEHKFIEAEKWTKFPSITYILERLQAEIPDPETLERFINQPQEKSSLLKFLQ